MMLDIVHLVDSYQTYVSYSQLSTLISDFRVKCFFKNPHCEGLKLSHYLDQSSWKHFGIHHVVMSVGQRLCTHCYCGMSP